MPLEIPRGSWSGVKSSLTGKSASELVSLLRDLYELSPANRQFLHARFGARAGELERYRASIRDALWPDPLKRGGPSVSAGKRSIRDYERATGDHAGSVDLMLTFVEAGVGFSQDVGFGEDAWFASLERMLAQALERANRLSSNARVDLEPRLAALRASAEGLGWGFGDLVASEVGTFLRRAKRGATP